MTDQKTAAQTTKTKNTIPAPIVIISGEGESGTAELYTGEHTTEALDRRLKAERCSGDRWARALVHPYETKHGDWVGVSYETGARGFGWPEGVPTSAPSMAQTISDLLGNDGGPP